MQKNKLNLKNSRVIKSKPRNNKKYWVKMKTFKQIMLKIR